MYGLVAVVERSSTICRSTSPARRRIIGFKFLSLSAMRGKLDSDVCIIEGKDIFVRGCLEIPIIGHKDCFIWGVWVSVSEASFARILELWDAPVVENEPPKFGWLCNNISLYPTTLNLKTTCTCVVATSGPRLSLSRRTTRSLSISVRAFPLNGLRKSLLHSQFDTRCAVMGNPGQRHENSHDRADRCFRAE